MAWSSSQRERLFMEKNLLLETKIFANFEVYNPTENTYWQGYLKTSRKKYYLIRVEIPTNYPFEPPACYIVEPCPLTTYEGKNLYEFGASSTWHTFSPKNNWVRMCLYRPERWSANNTIYKILWKARVWIEAYDEHKRTGKMMDAIVREQA